MALQGVGKFDSRSRSAVVVGVITAAVFCKNLARSQQYSIRGSAAGRTLFDRIVEIGGPYLVGPGLLFVALYLVSASEPERRFTGRFLLSVFVGVLCGGLLGQYLGVAPHALVLLLSSATFAPDPGILRLWVDVAGPVVRDFLSVLGILVVVRVVRARSRRETGVTGRTETQ